MADLRRMELDDLLNRPGTYYNPQTEVLIVVDDSAEVDTEIFDSGDDDEPEWVLISDEVPVEDSHRDELLERFHVRYHSGDLDRPGADDEDHEDPDEDELEPDPDPED